MAPKLDDLPYIAYVETPLGSLKLTYDDTNILDLRFQNITLDNRDKLINNQVFKEFKLQISKYFDRKLKSFQLSVSPRGTDFQMNVWRELQQIPFGEVVSYSQLAIRLGGKEKTRAVASAIARNPILILIPCHRVIGADGGLTGFSGGIDRKKALLELESNRMNF